MPRCAVAAAKPTTSSTAPPPTPIDVRMTAESTAVNHAMDVRHVMPVVLDALAAGDQEHRRRQAPGRRDASSQYRSMASTICGCPGSRPRSTTNTAGAGDRSADVGDDAPQQRVRVVEDTRREVDRESKRGLNLLVNRIHLTSRQTAAPAATPRAPAPESASRMALQHRRRRSPRPATLMKAHRRGRPCACFAGRNAGGHARTAAAPATRGAGSWPAPAATLCTVRRLMTRSAATTAATSAQRKRRNRAGAAVDFTAAERGDRDDVRERQHRDRPGRRDHGRHGGDSQEQVEPATARDGHRTDDPAMFAPGVVDHRQACDRECDQSPP